MLILRYLVKHIFLTLILLPSPGVYFLDMEMYSVHHDTALKYCNVIYRPYRLKLSCSKLHQIKQLYLQEKCNNT